MLNLHTVFLVLGRHCNILWVRMKFPPQKWQSNVLSRRIKVLPPPVCVRPSLLGVNVKPSSGKGHIKDFWCFASSFRWWGWQICCWRVVYPVVDVEMWNFLKMCEAILQECNFCWQLTWWQTWIWFMLLGMYNVVDKESRILWAVYQFCTGCGIRVQIR